MLTILLEKKFNCQLLLQIGLISFLLCPLVTEVWGANLKKKRQRLNIKITQTINNFETQFQVGFNSSSL